METVIAQIPMLVFKSALAFYAAAYLVRLTYSIVVGLLAAIADSFRSRE